MLVITGDLLVERLEDEGGPEPLEQRQGDVAEKEGVDLASRQRGGGPRAERGAPEAVGDVRPVDAADRQEAQREGGADQLVGNREDGPQRREELEEVDKGELRAAPCVRASGRRVTIARACQGSMRRRTGSDETSVIPMKAGA